VPVPSFARTEPEEKLRFACPAFRARKVMARIFPEAPVYPGLSAIPSKLTVPALFENDGSTGHKERMDPCLEMETTSSLSHGNDTTPETAFIAWSTLSTVTFTEKLTPTPYEPDGGEKLSVAALIIENGKNKIQNDNAKSKNMKYEILNFKCIILLFYFAF